MKRVITRGLVAVALVAWSCGQPGVEPCASIKDDDACDAHEQCWWLGPSTLIEDDVDAVVVKEGCYRGCALNDDDNTDRVCPEEIPCIRVSTAMCGYGASRYCLDAGGVVVTLCDDPRLAPPP